MADGQELDNLLIKVDSELGDLKGLDTAIDALQRLATFQSNATSGIKQLKGLGSAFHSFDNLKLDGLSEATNGIRNLISALDDLSKVGKVTKKQFNDFGKFGKTLKDSFDGIGTALKGIEEVSWGVNNMVKTLSQLGQVQGVTKSVISQLGSLGTAVHSFNGIDKDIEKIVEPIKDLMNAIGNLGNNNRVSIRVDSNGIANVNQVLRNTRKQMTSFNDWWRQLAHEKNNINLGNMFDITQPTDDLQRNLSRAHRMLSTYENQVRTSYEKLKNMNSMFGLNDLVNEKSFRNAFRSNVMADAMAEQIRQGIDRVRTELENRGSREIEDAWQHTLDSIVHDSSTLDLGDLIDTNLPIDQIRANLRTLQNELSRTESSMRRASTELYRLRSLESDEQALRSQGNYRSAFYTYNVGVEYARQYRDAIRSLNEALREQETLQQSDASLLRELPQLQQQLERYQGVLDNLLRQDDTSTEGQKTIDTFIKGVDYLESRIREIRNLLGSTSQTTEGVLEFMRQTADETERMARATAEANQNLRNSISEGFGQFGSALSSSGSQVLGSLGNLSSMFGRAVSNGTAQISQQALQGLQGVAGTLGRVATGMSQVTAVASVFVAVFKSVMSVVNKLADKFISFLQGLKQFAKNMLTHVVGAFNAVSGAVSKVVSSVRSGAQAIETALRKMVEIGKTVISVFAKFGSVVTMVGKGAKAIASLMTPRTLKNLVSANSSIKDIVKNSRLLSTAVKSLNKWFTMLTRMLMRKIVQQFISSMKQAFDDMVLYEKNASDQMLQLNHNVSIIFSALRRLGNQVIAIFEPIINAVATPIESFLTGLQAMAENVARFMAILTGQPYYLRAKQFYEDYGQNVEDTTKKVKNLTNGLDELNILNDTKDSDTGIDVDKMFEKVPVSGTFDGIKIEVQKIIDWIKDFLKNIDWDWFKEEARKWVRRLFEIINTFLADKELWQLLGKTVGEIINFLFTIINEAVHDLDWEALGRDIAEFIKNALQTIDWALVRDTVVTLARGLANMWNEVFADKELWREIGKTVAHAINDVIVAYFDNFAWTFDFKNFADSIAQAIKTALEGIDWEQINHMVEGWGRGIVDVFNTIATDAQLWVDLGVTLRNAFNELIHAFNLLSGMDFVSLTENLKKALEVALDIDWTSFNEGIQNWAKNITDVINGVFTDSTFLNTITTSIGKLADAIFQGLDKVVEDIKAYDIGNTLIEALKNGLGEIDWENVFTLPADAINKLSEAIKGILDSMPEGQTLAQWIIDHLTLGWDSVDWELLEDNVRRLADGVVNFINGIIQDNSFWSNLGTTVGKTIDFILDVTLRPLANVDWQALANSLSEAVNKAFESIDFSRAGGDLGELTQKIVNAVDTALSKINWREIGRQIGDGIASFLREINPVSIAQTIYDAFKALSDSIGGVLEKMIANGSFYKIGQILANAFNGLVNGLANLLNSNKKLFVQAINQLTQGIVDYLKKNKKQIVKALNAIIDAIGDILSAKSNARHELVLQLADILSKTNLGDLLGTIIAGAIKLWIDKMILKGAMLKGIAQSFGNLVVKIFGAIKPYLLQAISSAVLGFVTSKLAGWITTAILSALGVANLPALIIGAIVTAIAGAIGSVAGWNFGDWISKKLNEAFGKGNNNQINDTTFTYEPTVVIDPVIDDSNLEDFNLDDYIKDSQDKIVIEDTEFGTITASQIEVEKLVVLNLDVDEINADFLYLGEIFADVLHVGEVDVNEDYKGAYSEMDKFWGDNPFEINAGKLTKDAEEVELNGDEFLKKLAKLANDTLKQLATILESILETVKEIFNFGNGIDELITTDGKELGYVTVDPHLDDIYATNLYVDNIIADTLNLGSIFADVLNVGTISGTFTGATTGLTSLGFADYTNLETPTFEEGGRWSDISGKIKSAEDFFDTFSDYSDEYLLQTKQIPQYFSDLESEITSGTLSQNDNLQGTVYDYLMDAIGNSKGVYGLMGNLSQDSIDNGGNGLLKMTTTELDSIVDDLKSNASLWNKLTNATSTADASELIAKNYESGLSDSDYFLRKTRANSMENEGVEGIVEDSTPQKKDNLKDNFDEAHVVDTSTSTSDSKNTWLSGLVLQTEYTMAEVYNVIDKWLGRIWRLLASFEAPNIFDGLVEELDGIYDSDVKPNKIFVEIKTLLDNLKELFTTLIEDGITCHCDCDCGNFSKELEDAINDWIDASKDNTDAINKWIEATKDTGHLDNNTDAKSKNTKAVEDNTRAIYSLIHNGLGSITCNCNCGGNCGSCALGNGNNDVVEQTVTHIQDIVNDIGDTVNGISDTIVNDIPNNPVSQTTTTTPTNPVTQTTSTTPTNPVSQTTTGGGGYTPTNPYNPSSTGGGAGTTGRTGIINYPTGTTSTTGTTGNGKYIVWNNANGTKAGMFANIGGKLINLHDDLSDEIKQMVMSGLYDITDSMGNKLSSKDRSTMLKYLRNRWKKGSNSSSDNDLVGWENYRLHRDDGSEASPIYAIVDGKKVKLSDYLDDDMKARIANGIYHDISFVTEDGKPITDDTDLKTLRDTLIARGWRDGTSPHLSDSSTDSSSTGGTKGDEILDDIIQRTEQSPSYLNDNTADVNSGSVTDPDKDLSLGEDDGTGKCKHCELKDKARRYGISMFDSDGNFIGWDALEQKVKDYENGKSGGVQVTTPDYGADGTIHHVNTDTITSPTNGGRNTNYTGSNSNVNNTNIPTVSAQGNNVSSQTYTNTSDYVGDNNIADTSSGTVKPSASATSENNTGASSTGYKNTTVFDRNTGITTQYDSEGNIVGRSKTKGFGTDKDAEWWEGTFLEGHNEALRQEEESKKAQEEALKKLQEEAQKNKEALNNSQKAVKLTSGTVSTYGDKAQEQVDKWNSDVEKYRSQGMSAYSVIMAKGTEAQKAQAQKLYESLTTNHGYATADPYQQLASQLAVYANKIDSNFEIPTNVDESSKNNKEEIAELFGDAQKYYSKLYDAYNSIQSRYGNNVPDDLFKKYHDGYEIYDKLQRASHGNDLDKVKTLSKELIDYVTKLGLKLDYSNYANSLAFMGDKEGLAKEESRLKSLADMQKAKEELANIKAGDTVDSALQAFIALCKAYNLDDPTAKETAEAIKNAGIVAGANIGFENGDQVKYVTPWMRKRGYASYARDKRKLEKDYEENVEPKYFYFNNIKSNSPKADFEKWYKDSFLVKGYQMGGTPSSGEIFVSRENGTPEFVGRFGNNTAVANNEQIVTAVANGVAMANDGLRNAIEAQTDALENAIDRKNLDVQIGDRQIAEANRRGEKGLGQSFIN